MKTVTNSEPDFLPSQTPNGDRDGERRVPVAIQRLIDEVRLYPNRPAGAQMFDRAHNRHNRS